MNTYSTTSSTTSHVEPHPQTQFFNLVSEHISLCNVQIFCSLRILYQQCRVTNSNAILKLVIKLNDCLNKLKYELDEAVYAVHFINKDDYYINEQLQQVRFQDICFTCSTSFYELSKEQHTILVDGFVSSSNVNVNRRERNIPLSPRQLQYINSLFGLFQAFLHYLQQDHPELATARPKLKSIYTKIQNCIVQFQDMFQFI